MSDDTVSVSESEKRPAAAGSKYVVQDEQLGIAFGKSGALLFASSGGRYLYASNHVSSTRHLSDQQVARLEEFLSRHRNVLGAETVASIRERYLTRRDVAAPSKHGHKQHKEERRKQHHMHTHGTAHTHSEVHNQSHGKKHATKHEKHAHEHQRSRSASSSASTSSVSTGTTHGSAASAQDNIDNDDEDVMRPEHVLNVPEQPLPAAREFAYAVE